MSCVSITILLWLATMLRTQVICQFSGGSYCPCLKTSNRVLHKENIESYMTQKAVCHIDAVLFKTVSGLTFCSNPQKPWVKKAMEFVDQKLMSSEMTAHPINSTSTFKITSKLNTASDWNEQDEQRTTSPELLEFPNKSTGHSFCPCLKMSEAVLRKEDIKSYKIHKADVCQIDTIEFKTFSGLTICSNPQKLWVKIAMEFVNKKATLVKKSYWNFSLSFRILLDS
ncbi:chemokine (C-X-C motif) ligand 32b, duplicate 1 [Labeo rohita]|uniref:chemokine (C-X-C motif) ligand 32b, duplicate 1 n=1 Tax=Labeo rohita TaxID=84645 RepID=UPI0021E30C60|nr:chemokine (C-X-C motif) ligand 32b, duplicate 1 [Labeo rohita]